jgi:hypothetical protein
VSTGYAITPDNVALPTKLAESTQATKVNNVTPGRTALSKGESCMVNRNVSSIAADIDTQGNATDPCMSLNISIVTMDISST